MNARSGQIGIILLLVSVVMLTIGISVASRSTSDISISTSSEIANRAFDAAESGVEQALAALATSPETAPATTTTTINGSSVTTTITQSTILETSADQGYVVGVNVTGSSGNIQIEWAKEAAGAQRASLAISVFNATNTNLRRFYYAPQANTHATDGFTNSGNNNGANGGYSSIVTIPLAAGDQLVRIRPVYASTDVRVSGLNLPTQEYIVKAVATDQVSSETKAVQVERGLPMAPAIFDYVLYSGTSITP